MDRLLVGRDAECACRQIGEALFISPRTVEMHVQGSLLKLQCRTRTEAVRRLAELRTLPPSEGVGRRLSS